MPAREPAPAPVPTRRRWPLPIQYALVLALASLACSSPQGPDETDVTSIDQLTPGWHRITGGAETGCAFDTPFSFWVRAGDPNKLLVHFQAGGACWSGDTCDPVTLPTFDPVVDTTDHPSRAGGILNFHLAENPVRDFSIVYIPYCTGDLHLGSRSVTYTSTGSTLNPSRTFSVRHGGAANAERALRWITDRVTNPQVIFVTGSSAGAIASPVYAAQLAAHYPNARVVQLGDAAGGYRVAGLGTFMAQGGALAVLRKMPDFATVDSANFTFEDLYVRAARGHSNLTITQYNSAEDATQLFFLRQLGLPATSLTPLLAANLADIRAAVPGFHAYTAPGVTHTILFRSAFFTLAVDGLTARDWVAALLDGTGVSDIGSSLLGGT